jgi:glycerol-3-phosphate dehydrogenase
MKQVAQRFGVALDTVAYLISLYGTRYWNVLKLIDEDSSLRVKLCTCSSAIRAQVAYAVKIEMALTNEDVYSRRLQLQYNDCISKQCRSSIDDVLKTYVVE